MGVEHHSSHSTTFLQHKAHLSMVCVRVFTYFRGVFFST